MEQNETYKGYQIKIMHDEDSESPRNWDNLGTMVCFHSKYALGDEHRLSIEDAREIHLRKDIFFLPLYLYDHGRITMSTTPFSCPWDSGQIGYIYVTKEKVRQEWGKKYNGKRLKEKILDYLRQEVKTYDQYLTGDVWGYEINGPGIENESCWGFYGHAYCMEQAQDVVDWLLEQRSKNLLFRKFN